MKGFLKVNTELVALINMGVLGRPVIPAGVRQKLGLRDGSRIALYLMTIDDEEYGGDFLVLEPLKKQRGPTL